MKTLENQVYVTTAPASIVKRNLGIAAR